LLIFIILNNSYIYIYMIFFDLYVCLVFITYYLYILIYWDLPWFKIDTQIWGTFLAQGDLPASPICIGAMQTAVTRVCSRFKFKKPAVDLIAGPTPPEEESEAESSAQLDHLEMDVPDDPVVSPVSWWSCWIFELFLQFIHFLFFVYFLYFILFIVLRYNFIYIYIIL